MRIFKPIENVEIVCVSEGTRYGFRHVATLLKEGVELHKDKCCYYNRTWERYEFQSVLYRTVRRCTDLSEDEKKACNEYIGGDHSNWSGFKATAMVAMMGEVLCNNQKEKNDWKAMMLKAGLPGIEIPDDWNNLTEDQKTARLDAVIEVAKTAGKKGD